MHIIVLFYRLRSRRWDRHSRLDVFGEAFDEAWGGLDPARGDVDHILVATR